MLTEKKPTKDSPPVVVPAIRPSAPWRLASVRPLANYRLEVRFMDGTQGEIDLSGLVRSPDAGVFAALMDQELFNQVYLEYGAITWPGEIDLAPDTMYEAVKKAGVYRPS